MPSRTMKLGASLLALLMIATLVLSACGAAPEPETVIQTVVVEKEVEVEKIVTQEVEVEKIVTEVIEKEVTIIETVEVEAEAPAGARGSCGTVTLLYWQAVSMVNAYLSGGTKDIHAGSVVLESLARYNESGQLVPWLAEEIPTVDNGGVSEDLMSITWKLKPGVLWSDGTPLTSADAVFSAEYCLDPEMGCNALSNFADVESVEAIDELTFKINFSVPKPFPYGPLVSSTSPILQKAQFEDCMGAKAQECSDQNFYPIGTGPFKVKDFRANDVVVYEVNENFRDPNKPCFSEVVMKGGGDAPSAARAVLETGEADYAWNLQVEPEILSAMEAAGKGKVIASYGTGVERLMVNFTDPDPDLGEQPLQVDRGRPVPAPLPERPGGPPGAVPGHRPQHARQPALRLCRQGNLQRAVWADHLCLYGQRRLPDAGHRRRQRASWTRPAGCPAPTASARRMASA